MAIILETDGIDCFNSDYDIFRQMDEEDIELFYCLDAGVFEEFDLDLSELIE